VNKRERNERDYPYWEELPNGGRRYWKNVPGKVKNRARYVKIVDANEVTVSFVQEVYDDEGNLIARHQKYPDDTGHEEIEEGGSGDKSNGSA
jgi:hypothetical protein